MPYTREIATALRLIKKKGVLITLAKHVAGAVNTVTDRETGDSTQTTGGYGVVLEPLRARPGATFVADSLAMANTRRVIMAASGMVFAPEPGMTMGPVEGKLWRVITSTPLGPDGGAAIIHKVLITNVKSGDVIA